MPTSSLTELGTNRNAKSKDTRKGCVSMKEVQENAEYAQTLL